MPSLNWIGKEAVANHDKEVSFKLLKKVKKASASENSQNLVIHGDNLEALKALMPYYYGKIKCIYIDPPYNTGNEKWIYNDNVNSPKIKQWLKKAVKVDDLTRHDKWLCMMYPRLKLLRDLLSEDGIIFISIDENEREHLRLILDELFLEKNFITSFIWKKKSTSTNVTGAQVSPLTEYVIAYGKSGLAKIKQRIKSKDSRVYPFQDSEGKYRTTIIEKKHAGSYARESMRFRILGIKPREGKRWQIGEDRARELEEKGRFINNNGIIKRKIYDFEDKDTYSAQPNLLDNHGTTDSAQRMITEIFGKAEIFDNPKPIELISHLINITCFENDIILDSFAGSGTTGHAVLDLNKEDGGKRKFIMVEMEDVVAKDITAERVKRVIKKFSYKDSFEYCELDKALFDENGQIEKTCDFKQLATYIYFTETQTNIDPKKIVENFIGELGTTEYYLIYKGKNKNDLDKKFLKKIKKTKNKKVIYADRCLIDNETLL